MYDSVLEGCVRVVLDYTAAVLLLQLAGTFGMPADVTGATLLALGNGAPDLFTNVGSLGHSVNLHMTVSPLPCPALPCPHPALFSAAPSWH